MKKKLLEKLNSYYYSKKVFDNMEVLSYKPLYHEYYDIEFYGNTEIINIQPPSDYPKELIYIKGEHVIQQPYYFFIEKGYLIKNTPFLIDQFDNIIIENHGGRLKYPDGSIPRLFCLKKKPDLIIDDAIILNSRNSKNFYHWFVDSLSKLEALDYIENGWDKYKIVVTSPLKTWQKDSLIFLGVPEHNIVEAANKNIEVNNCLVLSPRRNHLRISKENLRWLRKKMLHFGELPNNHVENVFITRRKKEGRYLINEDEVDAVLSKKGYQKCYLDEYSLAQQIGLFSKVNQIVGIHGAGFLNIIFADNPNVVEIFSDRVHPFYYALTNAIDGNYNYITGTPSTDSKAVNNRKPFYLSSEKLINL